MHGPTSPSRRHGLAGVLQDADAGSIEQYGIELAVIPAAGNAAVIESSCYDSPRKMG